MRIHQVTFTNESVNIAYVIEGDSDADTGISEVRVLDIPLEVIQRPLYDDLIDSIQSLVEEARVLRRRPAEKFTREPGS